MQISLSEIVVHLNLLGKHTHTWPMLNHLVVVVEERHDNNIVSLRVKATTTYSL